MTIKATDISVDGFSFNAALEKNIFSHNNLMRKDIRNALLKIVHSFINELSIDFQSKDIRLTGSLANYNWSKYSDVDLHIIVDFNSIDEDYPLVKGYFDSVSALWNLKHDIKIMGYDVEIYIENVGEEHRTAGLYSVLNDDWIKTPLSTQSSDISFDDVKKKAAGIMNQTAELEKMDASPEKIIELVEKVRAKIRKMRKSGLDTRKGQYSTGNVAFKVLRRNGTLEKLSTIKRDVYDSSLSIEEIREAILRKLICRILSETPIAGYHPDESYEEGTVKNLMLDKETSHGGWPEGPSKSYTSDEPVNKQISDWLKQMKLVKK